MFLDFSAKTDVALNALIFFEWLKWIWAVPGSCTFCKMSQFSVTESFVVRTCSLVNTFQDCRWCKFYHEADFELKIFNFGVKATHIFKLVCFCLKW